MDANETAPKAAATDGDAKEVSAAAAPGPDSKVASKSEDVGKAPVSKTAAPAAKVSAPAPAEAKGVEKPKRGRGRPPGSKSKPKAIPVSAAAPAKAKQAPKAAAPVHVVRKVPHASAQKTVVKEVTAKAPPAAKASIQKANNTNTFFPKGDSKMATAPKTDDFTADFTNNFKTFTSDVEEKAKAAAKSAYDKSSEAAKSAYAKGTELVEETSEMTRKNAEALTASGKIFGEGLKDLGEDLIDDSRSVLSTIGEDFKKFAELKSPAEMFKFQAEIASRNFEALTTFGTRTGKAVRDLAQESFAPLAARAKSNYETVKSGF